MPTADQLAHLDIDVPAPSPRTSALLFDVASEIDMAREGADRTAAGAAWQPWPDITPTHDEAECDTLYEKDTRGLPAEVTQRGFLIWDQIEKGAGGFDLSLLARMAGLGIDPMAGGEAFVSAQFAIELESGSSANAIDLIGSAAVVAATAVSIRVGFARLETYLATTSAKRGMAGVFHLTPGVFVLAAADDLVRPSVDGWRTATGHRVVADAGHTGVTAPTAGGSDASADEAWIYATGDVWYSQTRVFGVDAATDADGGAVYVARNQHRPQVERYGLVGFDPNTVAAALVDVV